MLDCDTASASSQDTPEADGLPRDITTDETELVVGKDAMPETDGLPVATMAEEVAAATALDLPEAEEEEAGLENAGDGDLEGLEEEMETADDVHDEAACC